MIGPYLMDLRAGLPYACPILAGAGLSTTLAVVDFNRLSTQAAGALALAGLVGGGVVGGVVWAVNKYDAVAIERRKRWEEADKSSLSAKIEALTTQAAAAAKEQIDNQAKMRATLHSLANEAQLAKGENFELRENLTKLRDQFMQVSAALRETDAALHLAHGDMGKMREELIKSHVDMGKMRVQLTETADLLQATSRDRDALRAELASIRKRVGVLEVATSTGSGDGIPATAAPPATPEAPR